MHTLESSIAQPFELVFRSYESIFKYPDESGLDRLA